MNIIIHRGANQIGGCITEISSEGCKILIDLGSNLPGSKKEELTEEQIKEITEDADAIFYTHYHGDHVGLHHLIPASVKQYIGRGAQKVMRCKYSALHAHDDFSKQLKSVEYMQPYSALDKIDAGNKGKIFVTPYFVSHSAFDAYMFKIECEGKTILHTGDFRRHGYLGKGLFPTLNNHIGQIDILITEGTMLGRKQERVVSESQIQNNVYQILRKHKYVFALCSSTDIDRLASFHAVCRDTGRVFLVDKYQKNVLDIFTEFAGQKSQLFNFEKAFMLTSYRATKVKSYLTQKGFLMPIRISGIKLVKEMFKEYNDEEPWLIYSMWGGYAEQGKDYANDDIIGIRQLFGNNISDGTKDGVHTSGHADIVTLKEVCKITNPRVGVIPIHKDEYSDYSSLPDISEYKIFREGETKIENVRIQIR